MKKYMKMFSVLLVAMLVLTGCGDKEVVETNKFEEIMDQYTVDYYEKYQSGIMGMTEVNVDIAALTRANEKMGETYDLTKLEGCEETSYVTFTVNEDNTEIVEKEFSLECK